MPVKGIAFQCPDEMFHYKVTISPSSIACSNEVRDMLFRIAFPIDVGNRGA